MFIETKEVICTASDDSFSVICGQRFVFCGCHSYYKEKKRREMDSRVKIVTPGAGCSVLPEQALVTSSSLNASILSSLK